MADQRENFVWIFSGAKRHFPGGVFNGRETADAWIAKNCLT
jgi:hypothetical protein